MGGLGKTIIASKLYHSVNDFECKGWVCVPEEYNNQDILQSIIKSFQEQMTGQDLKMLKNMTEVDLERHLRKILEGRRYLLVIDDVWHSEAWESLKRALPENKNGSRVILTTRKKNVAIQASGKKSIHDLRFLTVKESWDLFQDKLFQGGDSEVNHCSPGMEILAKEMVGKCRGLPLAIFALAGILLHKDGLDEWRTVKKHIWRHLKNGCVHISELFSLSFDDLSPALQKCFLYTGMFPEDYVIDVRKLIRLWIAEELLHQGGERKEDLAAEFFNELINRSLIQGAGRFWEEIVKCRVHNLLRDLAIQKAKEVQLFDIYDKHKYSSDSSLYKRHAIHGSIQKYMSLRHSNMKLQTQLFFNQDKEKIGLNEVLSECSKFKSQSVLDLQAIEMLSEELPQGLGDLIHLKFLGLSEDNVWNIPSSIGNLKYLQTLEVKSYRNSCTLPTEICELKELRHLYGLFDKRSISFKNPTPLLTLGAVKYSEEFEASTVYLSNLQELSICYPSSLAFIAHLQYLATLIIAFDTNSDLHVPLEPLVSCKSLNKLWVHGQLQKLPTSSEFPPSLTRLILYISKLLDDPMLTLEKLPNLRSLELINAYKGKKMVCRAGWFPQLEVLRLRSLNELEEWEVDEGAMPKIRGMRIVLCEKLKEVPQRMMSVPRVPKSERVYCLPNYVDFD